VVEKLRNKLAPLDFSLEQSKAAVEEKNKDKYADLHAQQESMAQLEKQISVLGSELQDLRDLLMAKEMEVLCRTTHTACCMPGGWRLPTKLSPDGSTRNVTSSWGSRSKSPSPWKSLFRRRPRASWSP
jgi:hypothetical protein